MAGYLGRVRGVACGPDQVVICNGFGHGFSLVARALVDRGHTRFAVEVPGHVDPRNQVRWAGGTAHPVRVDADGLRTGDLAGLAGGAPGVVVVTPAHQAPTGVVLSPRRRTELAEWARTTGAYVVEDDYDAEYRYDRHPVGALQGVAPDRVIYGGTLSKSLAPGLRLGWIVVPPDLLDDVARARAATDQMTASLVQATFAEFLERGELDRHLRRTRLVYRERRDTLVGALERWLPRWHVGGVAAGLQAYVRLPEGCAASDVVVAAERAGVGVYPPQDMLADPVERASALLLGFGTLRPAQIEDGIRRLAAALAAG
jgi:GntR family transcriptional regulator/MocR family aminotransferase